MEGLADILARADAAVVTAMGVFARVGAAAFLVPGLGERAVPVRVRLAVALALTGLLTPLVGTLIPEAPRTVPALVLVLLAEAAAGLLIGLALRMSIFVLQIAGTTVAYHLSITHMFGSGVAPEPEPTIATFLSLGGVVLAMNAGLHVALVAALAGLYETLPFGVFPLAADAGAWSVSRIAHVFAAGVALALPFVVISFLYNLALGALNRAMPQLLVALVGVPLLVGLGLATLYLVLPAIYDRWAPLLAATLTDPLGDLH